MSRLWSVPKMWPGATVFIIGGGPSVNKEDLTPLSQHRVIGVNSAYRFGPEIVDILFFGDRVFLDKDDREDIRRFPGLKITFIDNVNSHQHGFLMLQRVGGAISNNSKQLTWKSNSGGPAIDLAVLMGAKKVVLIGYDMKIDGDGKHNFHDVYDHHPQEKVYLDRFARVFPEKAAACRRLGVEVIDTSMEGLLDCFPKRTLISVLAEEARDLTPGKCSGPVLDSKAIHGATGTQDYSRV